MRQPNLGGAGGFTRGMFDATAGAPEDDHDVLLLDDDILLEPEILLRLTAFAACTTHPTIVGGQMLNLLHPAHLHISAERADPELLKVGIPMPDALDEAYLLGSDERLLPIGQERRVDTEYNGWWACLVPATIIRAIGYPLPLFFQWDDIEFGYRARAHGFPTVALPGAGVWHADFGWKDWDEWHRYFNMRNGLITAALHTGFSTRRILRRLGTLLSQYLVAMHYGLAATLIKAVEDFLEGPEALDDGSAAAAAEIRRVRAAYPETVVRPMTELPELVPDFRDAQTARAANPPGNERLTWLKRAVWLAADRPGRVGFVPAGDAHWWHVSTFSRAVVTDMGEAGFRLRQRDRAKAKELARRGARALARLRSEGPAVAARFRAEHGRLDEPGELGAAVRGATREGRPPAARRVPRQRRRVGLHPHPRPRAAADRPRRGAGDGGGAAASRSWSATRGSACTSARTAAPCTRSPCWGSTRRGPCRSRGCASRTGATCRTPTSQRRHREERDFFGHFFYRLPNGESGADVDDRIAAFLTELRLAPPDAEALLVVTHGLAMRLLARRALGWSVALFEALSNPEPCEDRVLTLDGNRWRLDRPFAQWRTAEDGTSQ